MLSSEVHLALFLDSCVWMGVWRRRSAGPAAAAAARLRDQGAVPPLGPRIPRALPVAVQLARHGDPDVRRAAPTAVRLVAALAPPLPGGTQSAPARGVQGVLAGDAQGLREGVRVDAPARRRPAAGLPDAAAARAPARAAQGPDPQEAARGDAPGRRHPRALRAHRRLARRRHGLRTRLPVRGAAPRLRLPGAGAGGGARARGRGPPAARRHLQGVAQARPLGGRHLPGLRRVGRLARAHHRRPRQGARQGGPARALLPRRPALVRRPHAQRAQAVPGHRAAAEPGAGVVLLPRHEARRRAARLPGCAGPSASGEGHRRGRQAGGRRGPAAQGGVAAAVAAGAALSRLRALTVDRRCRRRPSGTSGASGASGGAARSPVAAVPGALQPFPAQR